MGVLINTLAGLLYKSPKKSTANLKVSDYTSTANEEGVTVEEDDFSSELSTEQTTPSLTNEPPVNLSPPTTPTTPSEPVSSPTPERWRVQRGNSDMKIINPPDISNLSKLEYTDEQRIDIENSQANSEFYGNELEPEEVILYKISAEIINNAKVLSQLVEITSKKLIEIKLKPNSDLTSAQVTEVEKFISTTRNLELESKIRALITTELTHQIREFLGAQHG